MTRLSDRKFWVEKNQEQEWGTVKISHPDFDDDIRLVASAFTPQTFAGETYIPAPMTRKDPQQDDDLVPTASASFVRAVIGDEMKRIIDQITPSGWLSPFTATLATWRDTDREIPMRQWDLYIKEGGITMNADSVTLSFSDDNPMIASVAILYDTSVFTGLELQTV